MGLSAEWVAVALTAVAGAVGAGSYWMGRREKAASRLSLVAHALSGRRLRLSIRFVADDTSTGVMARITTRDRKIQLAACEAAYPIGLDRPVPQQDMRLAASGELELALNHAHDAPSTFVVDVLLNCGELTPTPVVSVTILSSASGRPLMRKTRRLSAIT